jgi:hypothetical protein
MENGVSDEIVLSISRNPRSILLTADKDFGQKLLHAGVLLIRLTGENPEEKADRVSKIVDTHGTELALNFSVLTGQSFRVRRGGS